MCDEKDNVDVEKEYEKNRKLAKIKSFLSKTLEDVDFDDDGTFMWDCCNIHYCKKFRKKSIKKYLPACLRGGGRSPELRCPLEEKKRIREEALTKGFNFSKEFPY